MRLTGRPEQTAYARWGGEAFFTALIERFYEGVATDPLLRPLYPDDLTESQAHLALFLMQYWGGPRGYSDQRGHPRLRMRHAPFPIGQSARDRWVQLMDRALDEAAFPDDVQQLLREFFAAMATFMMNRTDPAS